MRRSDLGAGRGGRHEGKCTPALEDRRPGAAGVAAAGGAALEGVDIDTNSYEEVRAVAMEMEEDLVIDPEA